VGSLKMFTGIVTAKGKVTNMIAREGYMSMAIKAPPAFSKNLKRGASISVNGVCLTSKKSGTGLLEFDVIEETLSKSNLGLLVNKTIVNLERSMTALSEIGGHLVSGHIHTTGVVKALAVNGGAIDLRIELPKQFMQYIFYKGYVGLNGCSLTIGKVFKASFDIHLIPETLKISTFGSIGKGDLINIEIDQATINTVETVKKFMLEKKLK